MILMMSMFGTAMPTLLSFPEERPVFLREFSTNHYGTISYFISRLATEAIITFLQILVLVSSTLAVPSYNILLRGAHSNPPYDQSYSSHTT